MHDQASANVRSASPGVHLACGVGGALGIVAVEFVAALAVSLTFYNVSGEALVVVATMAWGVLVLAPVLWLWTSGGLRRWFSAGAAASLLAQLLYFAATSLIGSGTGAGDVEHRLQVMSDAGHVPVYYLGPSFHGWELDDVALRRQGAETDSPKDRSFDRGDELAVLYGSTCGSFESGTCGWEYELHLHVVTPKDLSRRCLHRLPPTRGITPVKMTFLGNVAFVGPLMVELAPLETVSGPSVDELPTPSQVAQALKELRLIGEPVTDADLPAPPRSVTAYIHKCPT